MNMHKYRDFKLKTYIIQDKKHKNGYFLPCRLSSWQLCYLLYSPHTFIFHVAISVSQLINFNVAISLSFSMKLPKVYLSECTQNINKRGPLFAHHMLISVHAHMPTY